MTARDRVWAVVLACAVAFLATSRCLDTRAGRADADLDWQQANAARVVAAYQHTRDSVAALDAARLSAERKLAKVRTSAVRTLAATDSAVDAVRPNVSADTATVSTLRANLAVAVASYDSLAAAFRAYVRASDAALDASRAQIAATAHALQRADAALAAKDAVIAAMRQRECRVLGLPCPTRRTAFLAGAVATLAAVVGVGR